jgi:hypothetical protein
VYNWKDIGTQKEAQYNANYSFIIICGSYAVACEQELSVPKEKFQPQDVVSINRYAMM